MDGGLARQRRCVRLAAKDCYGHPWRGPAAYGEPAGAARASGTRRGDTRSGTGAEHGAGGRGGGSRAAAVWAGGTVWQQVAGRGSRGDWGRGGRWSRDPSRRVDRLDTSCTFELSDIGLGLLNASGSGWSRTLWGAFSDEATRVLILRVAERYRQQGGRRYGNYRCREGACRERRRGLLRSGVIDSGSQVPCLNPVWCRTGRAGGIVACWCPTVRLGRLGNRRGACRWCANAR